MQWDLGSLSLRAGSQRVQDDKRYYVCPGAADGVDDECSRTIRREKNPNARLFESFVGGALVASLFATRHWVGAELEDTSACVHM